jgi:hypothetical protein
MVSARVDELVAWKSGATPSPLPVTQAGRWRWAVVALVVVVLGVVAMRIRTKPIPASARLEEHALVVLDVDGVELWRARFPGALVSQSLSPSQNRIWIGDLDGDRSPEVLFGRRDIVESGGEALICYSNDGQERWRFTPGRTVNTDKAEYAPPYGIHSLAVAHLNGEPVIALSSYQYPYAPAHVALLDRQGRALGVYWHFGHLPETVFVDLVGRGRPFLYLGGISNQNHAATLVVLDPQSLRGECQGPDGPFRDIPRRPEHARILFPRSQMNERFEPYNGVSSIDAMGQGLMVHVRERYPQASGELTAIYQLDRELGLKQLGASDKFTSEQARLHREGTLSLAAGAELDRLADLYRRSLGRPAGAELREQR